MYNEILELNFTSVTVYVYDIILLAIDSTVQMRLIWD